MLIGLIGIAALLSVFVCLILGILMKRCSKTRGFNQNNHQNYYQQQQQQQNHEQEYTKHTPSDRILITNDPIVSSLNFQNNQTNSNHSELDSYDDSLKLVNHTINSDLTSQSYLDPDLIRNQNGNFLLFRSFFRNPLKSYSFCPCISSTDVL